MVKLKQTEKKCSNCNEQKPFSAFYSSGRSYSSWCKDCVQALSRQRVLDGRDRASKIKYEEAHGHIRGEARSAKASMAETAFKKITLAMWKNATKRAVRNGKPSTLTLEQVRSMVTSFCKTNFCVMTTQKHPFKPSLDRIDNNKGYTPDNVKIVWLIENYCRNTFTEEDVTEFCKRRLGALQSPAANKEEC